MLLCGSCSSVGDDPWRPATPRKSKIVEGRNKNPFSTIGLEKFAMVSAELEAKRRKIMAQMGSPDSSLVRFVYSHSHGWVPVVVKLRDQKLGKTRSFDDKKRVILQNPAAGDNSRVGSPAATQGTQGVVACLDRKMKKSFSWSVKDSVSSFKWKRPGDYGSLVLILVLVCLVLFGRVFAIFCTCIWWYLVPTMKASSVDHRNLMKKKNYGRKISGKRFARSATTTR